MRWEVAKFGKNREADVDVIVMPKYVWQNSGTVVAVAAALSISSTINSKEEEEEEILFCWTNNNNKTVNN